MNKILQCLWSIVSILQWISSIAATKINLLNVNLNKLVRIIANPVKSLIKNEKILISSGLDLNVNILGHPLVVIWSTSRNLRNEFINTCINFLPNKQPRVLCVHTLQLLSPLRVVVMQPANCRSNAGYYIRCPALSFAVDCAQEFPFTLIISIFSIIYYFRRFVQEPVKSFPPKVPRRRPNNYQWMTKNVKKLVRTEQRHYNLYMHIRSPIHINQLKQSEKKGKKAVRAAKKYFERKIAKNGKKISLYDNWRTAVWFSWIILTY